MTLCSESHPTRSDVTCDKGVPCFGVHANAREKLTWPGNPLPARPEPEKKGRGTRKADLALIAQRARR